MSQQLELATAPASALQVEAVTHPQRPGFVYASFTQTLTNIHWPNGGWDGIEVRILQYQADKGYLVDAHASRPDWSRKQFNLKRRTASFEEASAIANAWLEQARAFVAATVTEANCPERHVVGAMKHPRDNWCRECGWSEGK